MKNNITIASIPCGVMDDLTQLNTEDFHNINYVGIDYDQGSIELAQKNTHALKNVSVTFYEKNAWDLNYGDHFDIITSNGLNIYEANDNKVIDLYHNFYLSLKPNAMLITSFLTPPPSVSKESTWKNYNTADLTHIELPSTSKKRFSLIS